MRKAKRTMRKTAKSMRKAAKRTMRKAAKSMRKAAKPKSKKKGKKSKRKSSPAQEAWKKRVMMVYRSMKKVDPDARYGDAMKEAAKNKNRPLSMSVDGGGPTKAEIAQAAARAAGMQGVKVVHDHEKPKAKGARKSGPDKTSERESKKSKGASPRRRRGKRRP